MNFQGKAAIVTGSATGVGAATAILLASKACNVVINYTKSKTEAEQTLNAVRAKGAQGILVQADVAKDSDCRKLAEACLNAFGRIDGLVNNAGITKFADHRSLDALDGQDFQQIYAVNVIGAYQMVRAVAPAMKAQGEGAIVNISSVAGILGIGSSIAYAASKGALNTMTLSLARVLGPEIRINAICPGLIEGRWLKEGYGEARYNAIKQAYEEAAPLQRGAKPEDIAEAAVWFLESARLVTGETLIIDSGMHLTNGRLKA